MDKFLILAIALIILLVLAISVYVVASQSDLSVPYDLVAEFALE